MTKKTTYLPVVFTVLLVLITAMMGSFDLPVQKWTALACLVAILAVAFLPKAKSIFKSYTTPLFIAMLGYVIWNGVSMFYADVPKAALFEFTKLIASFAVFMAVLFFVTPTKKSFKIAYSVLSVTTAFFGIVSIDAASNGPIATAFKGFMGLFTNSMQSFGVFENGIRMTGIFGNANTFAGFMALGILLSLALVIHSDTKTERTCSVAILAINSLSYILLFSLGSIFMFLIACVLMIITSKKEDRLSLFILMAETAIITLIFTGVALISMGTSAMIPIVAVVLNAAVLWCFDTYVRQAITAKLEANSKGSRIGGIAVLVLLLVYIVAALNVTGSLTLSPSETVMRGAYLDGGEYKLSQSLGNEATGGNVPNVRIITQNHTDLKVHTSTELYNGALGDINFTVPKDSEIVKLYFTGGAEGSNIAKVSCLDASTDSEKAKIKLDYKLLPAIAANRIQDLRANENSVQRIVFFEDGMKLFKQSPVIGQGLSGYEMGVASVQNFFYETRYVHNHYIQALCDLGIIGFALFMSILVLCVTSVVRLFKSSKVSKYTNLDGFALPVMVGCIFLIFGQAITDLTWSAGPFLIICFAVIGLLILATVNAFTPVTSDNDYVGDNVIDQKCKSSDSKSPVFTGDLFGRIAVIAVALIMTVLLGLNLYATLKAASGNCTMPQMAQLSKLDKFEGDDYKTSYIVTASSYGLEENFDQANKFATELTHNTDVVLNYLLPYYFNTAQDDKLFETASIAAHNGKASPYIWNRLFEIFATAINPDREDPVPVILHLFGNKEYYIDGLLGYYRDLQKRNQTYLDDAMLDSGNVAFIGKLLGVENLDNSDLIQAIDVFSKNMYDSKFSVDANLDGIPDNVTVLSGSTVWGQTNGVSSGSNVSEGKNSSDKKKPVNGFDGTMKAAANTIMEVESYCVNGGEYTFRLVGLTGLEGSPAPRDLVVNVDGKPATVQYDENGAFVTVTLRGAVVADETKNIKASSASTEKFSVTLPTGGQMSQVMISR